MLLGYGRTGIALRRRLPGWPDEPLALSGKRVMVTGATGGIGKAAAARLVASGADVVVVGRNPDKVAAVADELGARGEVCDVSDLPSVRSLVARWDEPLDVLVHNAGVMPAERTLTRDGVELAFATNVLGPWLLTRDLAPRMPRDGRVVNVSSGGMYGQRLDADLQSEDYAPVTAYARTKRAEVVLTEMWAERLADRGIVVHAMHPGWALTPGVEESMPAFRRLAGPILRTPEEGADTIVYLAGAATPGRSTGQFWHDRRPRPTYAFGLRRETAEDRERLWRLCEELAG